METESEGAQAHPWSLVTLLLTLPSRNILGLAYDI